MSRLTLHPIDDEARNGKWHLLGDGDSYALVRWSGDEFVFGSGLPLNFEPTGYYTPASHLGGGAPRG